MESSPSGVSSGETQAQQHKRSRILLSCAPCRFSKLKCDRDQPCGQCTKKGRADQCAYAPKPEKKRPIKGMSARLKRLEGMVREMIDTEGPTNAKSRNKPDEVSTEPPVRGQVYHGEKAMTYVGATHCMAMLEDIEDLKSYFDQPDDPEDDDIAADDFEMSDLILFPKRNPRNRQDLLAHLPEQNVADRLITRYFAASSPSQHIVHRPTFTRKYARFWQDPDEASLHWIAQLFMTLSLGVHFNHYMNPGEVEGDSPKSAVDRIRQYKYCAGWALSWGKYAQPNTETLQAFLLYVESDFLFNRAGQMNCYILSGVCIRLMLKMGLHRDPSKLANISPFESEMRRRMWNMAIQVELLVSFHMGLPSMLQGIETDTAVPRNLQDDDFDEDSPELPLGRPSSDYTSMTYPVHKTNIMRVFGQIARQAHALTPPAYSEVLRLDNLLQETWKEVPSFMKYRPLDECVGVLPTILIHRFGLGSLYNKCRCVLHRRYLSEAVPKPEHDYSRKQCLEGALALLDFQSVIWEACKPGHVLSQNGWFISSLAVHDFLLSAMVVYIVIKNENYSEEGGGYNWMTQQTPGPSKAELKALIQRSHFIWSQVAENTAEVKKTADTLAIMLAKLGCPVDNPADTPGAGFGPHTTTSSNESSMGAPSLDPSLNETGVFGHDADIMSSLGLGGSGTGSGTGHAHFPLGQPDEVATSMSFSGMGMTTDQMPTGLEIDGSWMQNADNMDWRYLDVSLAHSHDAGRNPDTGRTWIERPSLGDMNGVSGLMGGLWEGG
ncbi:hypothetical protein G7046_g6435 [Stylonectria norvegica]|nr:hypothetical protein G7046_g6435 [Stylonectria norvegica]